jgi:hypothetical protein
MLAPPIRIEGRGNAEIELDVASNSPSAGGQNNDTTAAATGRAPFAILKPPTSPSNHIPAPAADLGYSIRANLAIEWTYFKVGIIWTGIICGAVIQWVHAAAHNLVYYIAGLNHVYGGPSNQLVDMGFLSFPDWSELPFLPSNACLYSLGLIAAFVAFSPSFGPAWVLGTPRIRTVQILWRGVIMVSITAIFRAIGFLITVLPAPAPHCSALLFDPPRTAVQILFSLNADNGCSDLIFSAHMMYGILSACLVTHYLRLGMALDAATHEVEPEPEGKQRERALKHGVIALCWILVVMEAFCIVAQRRHYSIDVWAALYTCPMTWISLLYFFPTDPAPAQLPVVVPAPVIVAPSDASSSLDLA